MWQNRTKFVFIGAIITVSIGLIPRSTQSDTLTFLEDTPDKPGILLFNDTGEPERFIVIPGVPADIDILPTKNKIAIVTMRGEFLLYDIAGSILFRIGLGPLNDVDALPTSNEYLLTSRERKQVFFYNQQTGRRTIITHPFIGPTDADVLPNGNLLVCDASAGAVIEITQNRVEVWRYDKDLLQPLDALRLSNGHTLITDFDHHRILDINPKGECIKAYTGLNHPRKLTLRPNGAVLFTDSDNQSLKQITPEGGIEEIRNHLNYIRSAVFLDPPGLYLCAIQNRFHPSPTMQPPPASQPSVTKKETATKSQISLIAYAVSLIQNHVTLILFGVSLFLWLFGIGFGAFRSKTIAVGYIVLTAFIILLSALTSSIAKTASSPPYQPDGEFALGVFILFLLSYRQAKVVIHKKEQWKSKEENTRFPFSIYRFIFLLVWPIAAAVAQYYHQATTPFGFILPWYVPMGIWLVGVYCLFSKCSPRTALDQFSWTEIRFGTHSFALPFLIDKKTLIDTEENDSENTSAEACANSAVFILVIASIFLYTIQAAYIPTDVNGDEGNVALHALKLRNAGNFNIFTPSWFDIPNFFFLLPASVMYIVGDTITGIRLAGALYTIIAIPFFYLLGKRLMRPTTAAIAAYMFVCSSYMIHFSRLGTGYNQTTLLTVIVLFCFVKAIQDGKTQYICAAGFISGLGFLSYQAGKLLLPLLLISILLAWIIRLLRFNRAFQYGILCIVSFWISASPLVGNYFFFPDKTYSRMNTVSILSEHGRKLIRGEHPENLPLTSVIARQLNKSVIATVSYPDKSPFYVNNKYGGLLDPIPATLFSTGVLFLLAAFWRPTASLLLAWVVLTLLTGSAMTISSPPYQRLTGLVPLLFFIAAPILHAGIRQIVRVGQWPSTMRFFLTVFLTLLISAFSIDRYFNKIMQEPQQMEDSTRAARYLQQISSSHFVFFLGSPYFHINYQNIRFMAPDLKGKDIINAKTILGKTRRSTGTGIIRLNPQQ